MDDRKNIPQNNNVVQNLILENREKLTITGVVDVLSFDDQIVIVETQGFGLLTIKIKYYKLVIAFFFRIIDNISMIGRFKLLQKGKI